MTDNAPVNARLPSGQEIRLAVEVYLRHAYGSQAPAATGRFIAPEPFDVARWLMSDVTERDPADAPLEAVRSFALRIGNSLYRNMKLRMSRPPRDPAFVFTVDSHDAFLDATPGTPDHKALEELKRHNAALADRIIADWDRRGLPTERNYLRQKIRQARLAAQKDDTIIG